ncbi:MAG TPA: hypothetical protein VNY33_02820, partial [Gaiellaceae bacterium]|nr:hypothetical protein [Gaiellaceae bacterium]
NSFLTLKKAGPRYVYASDSANGAVNSEVLPAVRPLITVVAAAPDSIKAVPTGLTQVSAGSLIPASPGRVQLSGHLTDAFDNPITAATTAYLQVVNVSGATGYLAIDYGAGAIPAGVSTTVFTDTNGVVGLSPSIYYYVSSAAFDTARVWLGTTTAPANTAPYIGTQKDITGVLQTIGGAATQIVFLSSPTAAVVGITNGGQYTIETLDDFNNVTSAGWPGGSVFLNVVEVPVHTANGFVLNTFGPGSGPAIYGFRDQSNTQFITSVPLPGNVSQVSFRYADMMSSYSGPGPSSNTAQGGRPGFWTIQVQDAANNVKAQALLRMDPDNADQVNFANPANSQVAGKVLDPLNNLAAYQAELQDEFFNPVVATRTVSVSLSTVTRSASRVNDYVAFSLSSGSFVGIRTAAPSFFTTTATLTIPLGQYQTTFYYLDTTASSLYAAGGGTKPVIALNSPGLFGTQQPVLVVADAIDGIAITTGNFQPALQAGTTSQTYDYETRDIFGNPSPLRSGQDFGRGWVQMAIQTDSLGMVSISTPDIGAFAGPTAISYLPVGASASTFYLIDTLLTAPGVHHHLSVSGITYPNWAVAVSSYDVIPGPPVQISWANAPRRLIAGTTVELVAGLPVNTALSAQLIDQFGNVTTSTSTTYTINYTAPGELGAWGGVNGSAVIVATAPSSLWTNLGVAALAVPIPASGGFTAAPMYFWDTVTGGATVYAQAQIAGTNVFAPISQIEPITAGPAYYLTVHHPYTTANPLAVGHVGIVTIKARDLFGNVAAGDPQNGNYFTDKVGFTSSGSTLTVTLQDPGNSSPFHVFVATDAGVFPNLEVEDSFFEVLQVGATDFANPNIFGFTSDGSRTGLPATASLRSDANVEQAGIVISPADLAPESDPPPLGPIPPAKIGVGVVKKTLNQGDGTTPSSPDPIPMLRLSMGIESTLPNGLLANLKGLQVQSEATGNLNNSHVTELALYYDANGNGKFDPPPTGDELLSTGAYDGAGSWWFGNPI